MPKRIPDKETAAILAAIEKHPEGASRAEIEKALRRKIPPPAAVPAPEPGGGGTARHRSTNRAARYRLPAAGTAPTDLAPKPA